MRKIWAKILSGEVEEPGRTSLRTLDILKNMTKEDARIFGGICDYVIDDFIFRPQVRKADHRVVSPMDVFHLRDVGLLSVSESISRALHFSQHREPKTFFYGDYVLRFLPNDKLKSLRVPAVRLSGAGMELRRVVECSIRMDYLQFFSKFLHGKKCKLAYARIIARHPDGQVTHSVPFVPIEPEPDQPGDGAP